MKAITIPKSFVSMGSGTFYGCESLASIRFEGSVPSVVDSSQVFSGVKTTIYYPANNATWTEEVRNEFTGELTWVSYTDCEENNGHTDTNMDNICDECGMENIGFYTTTISTTTPEVTVEDKVYTTITASEAFSAAELTLTYDTDYLTFNESASTLSGASVSADSGTLTLADYGTEQTCYTLAFDTTSVQIATQTGQQGRNSRSPKDVIPGHKMS